MNPALWRKAVSDAWLQLVVSAVVLMLFAWLFVWLMSLFEMGLWGKFLEYLPGFFESTIESMIGVPVTVLATRTGQLSILYVHVITTLVCVGWAVGRGSDPITGELGRGTMDLILSLPIWRCSVLVAPAVVAAVGAAILASCVWLGTAIGVATVDLGSHVSLRALLPGVVNLAAMTVCLTGITTLVSSFGRSRWHAIFIAVAIFVVSFIIKMVGRMWPAGGWLLYGSFLTVFEPHQLILLPDPNRIALLRYNATLLGLALLCYVAAAIVISRRDIPAAR